MQKKIVRNLAVASLCGSVLTIAAIYIVQTVMAHDIMREFWEDFYARHDFHTVAFIGFMTVIFGIVCGIVNRYIKRLHVNSISDTVQKERKLAAIIAIASAGIIVKDKDGIVQEWNLGAENILGYKPEEIIGKTTKHYAPDEQHTGIDEIEMRMKKGEHFAHVEVVRKHKNGRLIDCSASYTPIFDEKFNFTGSVAVFHDISEKKEMERKRHKAEEELQKSYEDTAAILHEIPAPICVVSKNSHQILSCNTAFMFMCAAENKDAVLGTQINSYLKLYVGESEENTIIKRLCQSIERSANFTCALKKQDRTVINIEVFSRSFVYKEQEALAVYCNDLTKQKMHEQALFDAVVAAEEASKMKSSFLANMSHEIRTPMNGIIGFVELAADDDDMPAKTKDYLHKIKISAEGLLQIINDILDISKIEAGKMNLEKIPFDLHDTLRSCEAISSLKAAEKGIKLYFYVEPYIGKKITGDPTKLRQVLLNLLSNATKFTNYGIVKFTALVEEVTDDFVKIHFEVKDSGIGMTPEQIEKIFDPFSQGDTSTTRRYGGTGLGLPITKNYIELMGGKLKVESTRGIGSKFSFDLIFETIDELADPQPQEEISANFLKKPLFKADVLVCEDNVLNQEVIREHFLKIGINPEIAPNGAIGLRMAKERIEQGNPFDVIFMDIHMPVMDGLEASKILMKLGNKTPVIALTANIMHTDKQIYREYGMPFCLGKPFKAQELWACLFKYLIPVELTDITEPNPTDGTHMSVPDFKEPGVIDRQLGIRQIAGDEELYNRILTKFSRENKTTLQDFKDILREGDMKLAHRMAHTLKNSAGMIGATILAEAAFEVENSLADGKAGFATELAKKQLQTIETELNAVLDELDTFAKKADMVYLQPDSINQTKITELINELIPLLESGNLKSLEFIPALREVFAPTGEACGVLITQIENYDFELALETLTAIRRRTECCNVR